jgi:hypothetical protein
VEEEGTFRKEGGVDGKDDKDVKDGKVLVSAMAEQ